MPPPDVLTVQAVSNDGTKVQIVGHGDTAFGVSPKGTPVPQAGQQFKGWVNLEGNYGPYVKVADGNGSQATPQAPQAGFTPQPAAQPMAPVQTPQTANPVPQPMPADPQRESIERQVSAKIAAELIGSEAFHAMSNEDFAREFTRVTGAVHDAITDKVPF